MTHAIDRAAACFARLRASAPTAVRTYRFGTDRVRVRYLDPHLVDLLHPAIAHCETRDAGAADLTIHAFVSAVPPLVLTGDEWTESSKRLKSAAIAADALFTHLVPGDDGRLDVLHGAEREAFTCFRDVRLVPAWDAATPFRDLLQGWNRLHDGHVVHGGVVANDERAILLAGAGGSGKSSTTLACLLHSDLFFMGDDLCLVRRMRDGIRVHGLYNSVKLLAHDVARFATGLTHYDDSGRGDGKPTFFTYPALKDRLATERPLSAVLLPGLHDSEETLLEPAGAGDAWKAIGPSTLSLVPSDARSFKWLADVASGLPAWHLRLGRRRDAIPAVIKQALALCAIGDATAPAGARSPTAKARA